MSIDFAVIAALLAAAIPTGFVAYWAGVGHAERRARAEIERLRDDLDYAVEVIAAKPGTPLLRVVGGDA